MPKQYQIVTGRTSCNKRPLHKKAVTQGSTTTTYNYIWNGGKLISQSDGTNTFYFFYDESKYAPQGFVYNGADIYFYTKNLQGDITGIADSNGIVITAYTYDAWGKIISVTGTQAEAIGAANPFRYRGYYYDTETDLYYLQSRFYNPTYGRFLNADETGILYLTQGNVLGANLFAYCGNNLVNYADPTGHWAQNYKNFKWIYSNKKATGFSVNVNWSFLSRVFCIAYAADILRMKGTWNWWGKGLNGMSLMDIAVELFAHAVIYYYGSAAKRIINNWRLNAWVESGRNAHVVKGDSRLWRFYAIWGLAVAFRAAGIPILL